MQKKLINLDLAVLTFSGYMHVYNDGICHGKGQNYACYFRTSRNYTSSNCPYIDSLFFGKLLKDSD